MKSETILQETEHRHDLFGSEAIERIREIVKKAENCFFCTGHPSAPSDGIRPMNVRKIDDAGSLWFLSSVDSHKNLELQEDPRVTLLFQGSPHAHFLELTGRARISRDRALIRELWEPVLKNWFTEGENDPRISVIEVIPESGYYWDTKHGSLVAGVKMLFGAVVGKNMDDSEHGRVSP